MFYLEAGVKAEKQIGIITPYKGPKEHTLSVFAKNYGQISSKNQTITKNLKLLPVDGYQRGR